ncbi:hypothetical protein ADICYQ_0779 [Cyclobacterium qasimii M12-11B]|uniref:Uncharacterized protein n=1 Tax=Cyclobacterium qasimii M12-11B TaxID=641524 RepID=S7VL86_9BACT|nr:hypothetical protein ADICYQ_0779 [Cyclobacterium qasimii M12-11B]
MVLSNSWFSEGNYTALVYGEERESLTILPFVSQFRSNKELSINLSTLEERDIKIFHH